MDKFSANFEGIPEIIRIIELRDKKVALKANIITNPGFIAKWLFRIIRLGERGSVSEKNTMMK